MVYKIYFNGDTVKKVSTFPLNFQTTPAGITHSFVIHPYAQNMSNSHIVFSVFVKMHYFHFSHLTSLLELIVTSESKLTQTLQAANLIMKGWSLALSVNNIERMSQSPIHISVV